jgi:hypothetical protein
LRFETNLEAIACLLESIGSRPLSIQAQLTLHRPQIEHDGRLLKMDVLLCSLAVVLESIPPGESHGVNVLPLGADREARLHDGQRPEVPATGKVEF